MPPGPSARRSPWGANLSAFLGWGAEGAPTPRSELGPGGNSSQTRSGDPGSGVSAAASLVSGSIEADLNLRIITPPLNYVPKSSTVKSRPCPRRLEQRGEGKGPSGGRSRLQAPAIRGRGFRIQAAEQPRVRTRRPHPRCLSRSEPHRGPRPVRPHCPPSQGGRSRGGGVRMRGPNVPHTEGAGARGSESGRPGLTAPPRRRG